MAKAVDGEAVGHPRHLTLKGQRERAGRDDRGDIGGRQVFRADGEPPPDLLVGKAGGIGRLNRSGRAVALLRGAGRHRRHHDRGGHDTGSSHLRLHPCQPRHPQGNQATASARVPADRPALRTSGRAVLPCSPMHRATGRVDPAGSVALRGRLIQSPRRRGRAASGVPRCRAPSQP